MTEDLENQAKKVAHELRMEYIVRNKRSLAKLQELYGHVLLVTKEGLTLQYRNGQSLSFHPDTAMLRIKAPRDPLIELVGPEKLSVLDTTMGLASDALVLSYAGHAVTALESQPILHCIVARGLQDFDTGNAGINQAMRNIKTVCTDSLEYLKMQVDNTFDIIYCDPMFSEVITESENLSGLKPLANYEKFTEAFLKECKRVARRKIILKAHFRDTVFEDFGFTRKIRPYQKFHFGEIILNE
ncbi:SAM-dependent methyltransferase [Streptococcus varani]|uniref:SAM-dependent methyltransferase n=2 Tax=Streptococcus varani TaxID=1608583 RepID=A0A0E4CSE6_9STRE|nr:SAM-dependent methyltransferase [Streptococcus varani]